MTHSKMTNKMIIQVPSYGADIKSFHVSLPLTNPAQGRCIHIHIIFILVATERTTQLALEGVRSSLGTLVSGERERVTQL